ncbi:MULTISPECIES: hypothetical protein [unclassified Lentimonas]|uniref:hypothetical protein n=1 Tax=unclassified Lentimonas TaxID=2630993 RepID=UPI00132C3C41|nr:MULTISPECIES: hypothetical protein [unclassified Lentimonas]CAA6679455.1 Unannotated [Lentimonas sp. CC4]CAA6687126.1 Unannotated [Lentimonas sp. CC6]CAA7075527.1 Unannotated [Lentimonas sp. CC4]CAA7170294.1 Unannotated [Lentimonas sp. CC21]CAA7182588.1 Unannotated [Lentimonas sp. CC8]
MARSRGVKHFDILGEQVSKRAVYLGVAGVVVLIAVILGGGYYLMAKNRNTTPLTRTPESVAPEPLMTAMADPLDSAVVSVTVAESRESLSSPAPITSLRGLLELHIKATGFDEVNSYILNGKVSVEGNIWDLTLMAREPNLYKLKTESPTAELSFEYGYNGHQGWLRQSYDHLNEAHTTFYMSMMLLESSLTQLAWSYDSAAALEGGLNSVLELRAPELWNGRSCAVVESHGILPFSITHYIDTDTFEEVYRRAAVTGVDGATAEIELHFVPADGSTPHRLPTGYELYVDGQLHDTVTYTRTRVNRVMLSSLFDAPADCEIRLDLKKP